MPSTGHCFRWAYIATVMDIQEPSATRRNPYGSGPVSVPPADVGSSPISRWRPTVICCANPAALPLTMTVPSSKTSLLALERGLSTLVRELRDETLAQDSLQDLSRGTLRQLGVEELDAAGHFVVRQRAA